MTALLFLMCAQGPIQFEGRGQLARLGELSSAEHWGSFPVGERVARTAIALIGTPYVGWTLERDEAKEFCFVTLDGLDCVTLFESSLAYARALGRSGAPTAEDMVRQVEFTRYRGGKVDGYLSRLHYTGEWMVDNVAKGTVAWVKTLKSQPYQKQLNFMSTKSEVYRQLKANPNLLPELKRLEAAQSARTLSWIPKSHVAGIEKELKTGDIIGIATSQEGMDCSHTGLIVKRGDRALFLHASSTKKRVTFDVPISEYLARSEKNLGILVVRPL